MFGRLLRFYTTAVAAVGAGIILFGFWTIVLHPKVPPRPLVRTVEAMVLSCFLVACVAFTVLIWRREAQGSRIWDLAFRPRPAENELVAPWWWAQVYTWSLIAGIVSILALTVLA